MNRQIPRLVLALSLMPLVSSSTRAQAAPAKNPCANVSNLQSRADILQAVPADDPVWKDALDRRRIFKDDGGEWMQYYAVGNGGGTISASNSAFVAVLGDYCAAKAVAAASKNKPAAKSSLPPELVRANEENARRRQAAFEAQMSVVKARALSTSASSGEALPPEPPAPPDCSSLCGTVGTCNEAGMGGGNMGSDFSCRKAAKDAAAAKCTCS